MDRVRRIELLVRAADMGSFAKAARSLDLTPSAVSHAIAELEKELRMRMFHRTTRQLRLTEDGEVVYRRGCEILRQFAELDNDVVKAPERMRGTLRVGLSVVLSQCIVMPAISQFVRRYPNVRLQFHVQTQPKEMHSEGADVLLRFDEPPDSGLVARRVAQSRPGVYASPDYIKAAGAPAVPEDLLKHRCLLFKPGSLGKPIDEWKFERAGKRKVVKIPSEIVTHDRSGLITAVVAGTGLMYVGCFDPALVVSGRLRRVLTDWECTGRYNVYAIFRRTPHMPPILAAFLGFVSQAFEAFDPDELTIIHDRSFKVWAQRLSIARR